jgi:hypothetical protein
MLRKSSKLHFSTSEFFPKTLPVLIRRSINLKTQALSVKSIQLEGTLVVKLELGVLVFLVIHAAVSLAGAGCGAGNTPTAEFG